jgi:hypothetical protein
MYKTAAGRYVVLLAGARDEMRAVEPFPYTFLYISSQAILLRFLYILRAARQHQVALIPAQSTRECSEWWARN